MLIQIIHTLYSGLTIGFYAIGGLFGSLTSGYINNRFSRKTNLIIGGFWMILSGLLSSLSINTAMVNNHRIFLY